MDIIKINIYGYEDRTIFQGCSSGNKHSCSAHCEKGNCSGCSSSEKNEITLQELCENLCKYLKNTDICDNVDVSFISLNKSEVISYEKNRVEEIIERGFYPPIVVIDGIIRYYGGISNTLVYKDVKELLR